MAQLYFYYSAMNAGKSTALLQSSYNYQERGMRTVVYTAEIDDRFGAGKVSSRIGLSSPAELFNPETDLFADIRAEHASQPIHCVLVDESQFLTREQVHALSEVVDELDIPCCVMACVRISAVSYLPGASIYSPGQINSSN
jgi:thymidine kinase